MTWTVDPCAVCGAGIEHQEIEHRYPPVPLGAVTAKLDLSGSVWAVCRACGHAAHLAGPVCGENPVG